MERYILKEIKIGSDSMRTRGCEKEKELCPMASAVRRPDREPVFCFQYKCQKVSLVDKKHVLLDFFGSDAKFLSNKNLNHCR